MTTLAEVTLMVAELLMEVRRSAATGGSDITLVDTAMTDEPEDYFNGGTIWITSGDNEGKSARITDWALVTTRFTFPTMTDAVTAGTTYAAAGALYSRRELMAAVNHALQEVGAVVKTMTGTAIEGTLAYSLLTTTGVRALRVWTYVDEEKPTLNLYWKQMGTDLVFEQGHEPKSGETLRVLVSAKAVELTQDGDEISDTIPVDLLKWKAALYAGMQKSYQTTNEHPGTAEAIKMAGAMAQMLEKKYPARMIAPDPKLANW